VLAIRQSGFTISLSRTPSCPTILAAFVTGANIAINGGGELPEVGHQPGMRIRRQALAASLLSERQQRLFAEPSLHEGTRRPLRRCDEGLK
jgi:hypothetical protein